MKSTVPFEMETPVWFAATEGILSADETDLKLEFRTSDAVVGLIKSDIKQVNLPLVSIEEIKFQKSWFTGCSIVVRLAEMRAASDLPGFTQGEVKLEIARKHSQVAAEFVSAVQQAAVACKNARPTG